MPQAKHGRGRPPVRPNPKDPQILDRLCQRIISGESVHQICADPKMPAERTVYVLMARDEEFCRIIARAREAQQHAEIDKTIDLADKATAKNHQAVRLKIWARQWRAAKLMPKVYGEKVRTEISGPDGAPIQTVNLTDLSDDELTKLEELVSKLKLTDGTR